MKRRSPRVDDHISPLGTKIRSRRRGETFASKLALSLAGSCRALPRGIRKPQVRVEGAPSAALVTSTRAFASGSYRKRVRFRTSKRDASDPARPGSPRIARRL